MYKQLKIYRLLSAVFVFLLMSCLALPVSAQQINPNNLPPCPKPDYSKKTDVERFAKWTNCWGRYKIEINAKHKDAILEGEWLNGLLHGQGTEVYSSGDKYVGEFKEGDKHGQGTFHYLANNHSKGDKYEGQFKDGRQHGQGRYTWANGKKYEGDWKDGKYNGRGVITTADGSKYVGEFKNGKMHGEGALIYLDGEVLQEGIWADNEFVREAKVNLPDLNNNAAVRTDRSDIEREQQRHSQSNLSNLPPCPGLGKKWHNCVGYYTYSQGSFVGEYKNDLRHGQGVFTAKDGKRLEGVWEDDKFIREAKVNLPNLNNNVPNNSKLSETGREQQRQSQRVNLQVTNTQPSADGSFAISVQTNADTASLKINGEEQGGRADGKYSIKKVARIGQDTQFTITAVDINGNSDTKTITVTRQAAPAADTSIALKPEAIKRAPARDAVAIIIGIQDYKRVPRAEFANNDAKEFYEYAVRALGIKQEKINMLLDDEADEVNIVKAFENWLPIQVNKDKTDVYVFYSGHGLPAPDGKSLYFLPHGVDKELLSRTAVGQNEIVAALSAAKPKSVTMFIDACYSGQTRGGDVLVANAKPVSLKSDTNAYPPNFTVITASANDQISSSSPELKHGIFSFYLMKGMEGEADANKDGKITVGEMQDYLSDKVARQAMTLNRKQTTQLAGDAGQVLVDK